MKWVHIGRRPQSILDKSLKLLAWSETLNKELGWGYEEFITTKSGDQYVILEDDERILKLSEKLDSFLKYAERSLDADKQIMNLLTDTRIDYNKIIDIQLTQLSDFLIAKMIADRIYESSSKDLKNKIEKWRNSETLFSSQIKAFKSLAKFLNISEKLLNHMLLEEVQKAIKSKKVDEGLIEKRFNQYWSLVLKDGEIKLYLEDLAPIKESTNTKIIKGKVAFKNDKKIRGIVGKDILVTTMTHPGMLSKMLKMKAVITDEGGLLCHAAITAREFKIPTIIGTKIASKLLKNGDLVEMDIKTGVVKKLS